MSKTPVSILQEMMVKQGMIPDYELIHDGGGRHVNTFTYRVTCDSLSATGTGRCKKDAKHEAAKAMLTEIAAHRNYPQLPAANTPTVSPPKSPFHSAPLPPKIANIPFVNAVGELQELCAENNLHEPEYFLIQDVGPPHAKIFTIRCKVSNFEEDGIATTKKQAKHDAAKRMVDKIKGLMNNLYDFCKPKNKEDSSNSSVTTIDTDTMNKNAEERYRTLIKSRKINLGLKLADYHIYWRDSLETDKRDKILEQLECIFPNEMIDIDDYITEDSIMEKISLLETILSEIDITINMNDITSDKYCIKSIQLNTCPLLTQFGMGRNKLEASWEALSRIIKSIKLLLS
ncbi:PRKRA kinase, partial [Acromyrmex charruanus]